MTDNPEQRTWSIRCAQAEDYEAIKSVWTAAGLQARIRGRESREAFLHQLQQFPDLYLVAVDDERIIGMVFGSHDHRKGWINRLAVLPEHQRRGVAVALVTACDEAIRAQGIEIVAALVETPNLESARLFEKLGYHADVPVCYYRKLSHPDA